MNEVETKLAAHSSFIVPPLEDFGAVEYDSAGEPADLVATYWDTDDLALVRSGLTLRYRIEQGKGAWQLKLPATRALDSDAARRDELTVQGGSGRPPLPLRRLVTAYTRGAELRKVARLRTARRTVRVRAEGGGEALVCDDLVSVYAGSQLASRFRELEVESGDDKLRRRLVSRLVSAGAERTEQLPKLVRALGPSATRPADIAAPPMEQPSRARPVGDVVSWALLVDLERMIRHEPGTRLGEDIEDLHQMRVATRHLRSVLHIYRPVLEREWADDLRQRLRDVAQALGEVRDLDVLIARFEADAADLPEPAEEGAERIRQELNARRDAARGRLAKTLDRPQHAALLADLLEAARQPRCLQPEAPAGPELAPLADKAWRLLSKAKKAGSPLHEIRIDAKRLRYAAEAVEPAFGKPARRLASAAADLQDVLGTHQDGVVAKALWVELLRAHGRDAGLAFTLGILTERAERRVRKAERDWPDAWRELRRPALRSFLYS